MIEMQRVLPTIGKRSRRRLTCTPIYKRDDAAPESLGFRLGTLDTDPAMLVDVHFMVGSKAPWVEIGDDLPQEGGGPPFGKRD